jgi:hypothetical protein
MWALSEMTEPFCFAVFRKRNECKPAVSSAFDFNLDRDLPLSAAKPPDLKSQISNLIFPRGRNQKSLYNVDMQLTFIFNS